MLDADIKKTHTQKSNTWLIHSHLKAQHHD